MHPRASQVVLVGKNPPTNAGDKKDSALIPELVRFPGREHGNPLQFLPGESCGQRSLAGYSPRVAGVRHDWSDLVHKWIWSSKQPLHRVESQLLCISGRPRFHRPWLNTHSTSLVCWQAHLCCVSTVLRTQQLSGFRSSPGEWKRWFYFSPWGLVPRVSTPQLLSHDSLLSPALTLCLLVHITLQFVLCSLPASFLSVKVD